MFQLFGTKLTLHGRETELFVKSSCIWLTTARKSGMINLSFCAGLAQRKGEPVVMEELKEFKLLDPLFFAMAEYEKGVPHRIAHFTKVHAYAALIGRQEGLSGQLQLVTEAAALVHDIGIRPSLKKYQSSAGKYQQIEGPAPAREMLTKLGFPPRMVERICWLVAHHQTYRQVDGLDHRILLEADFLVNALEEEMTPQAIQAGREKVFATKTGRALLDAMYPPQTGE